MLKGLVITLPLTWQNCVWYLMLSFTQKIITRLNFRFILSIKIRHAIKPTLHLSFSLSLSHQNHVPRIALLQAPKKSHLHHWSFKRTIFFTELCGLFGFLCLGQSLLTEKTGKREPSYPFTSSLFLGPLFSYFFLSLTFRSIFPHPSPHPTHLLLSLFLPFFLYIFVF